MEIIDIEGVEKVIKHLKPEKVKKALPRAINKVGKMGRTALSKEIRKLFNITAKRINEELQGISGHNRATASNPRAIIRATKKQKANPGLQNFGAKQTKKGVSYRIRKDQGRKTRPRAFVASMPGGGLGIFLRKGKSRLPIVRQVGPSVVRMVDVAQTINSGEISVIEKVVKENLERLFLHEYQRELKRS